MKYKSIPVKGDKQTEFIRIIASQFGVFADNELKLIAILCKYDMFQAFWLDKFTRIKLMNELGCSEPTFNTTILRLTKSNVIARHGKTRYFNPSFRNLNDVDAIVFKYQE